MSEPVVQFANQANWQLIYNEERLAQEFNNGGFISIPAFELGFLLESHILVVMASSRNTKPTWRYAGELRQKLQMGSGGSGSTFPSPTGGRYALKLGDWSLIKFLRWTNEYELIYLPPTWFDNVTLKIYQYLGPESSTEIELLNTVISRLP